MSIQDTIVVEATPPAECSNQVEHIGVTVVLDLGTSVALLAPATTTPFIDWLEAWDVC